MPILSDTPDAKPVWIGCSGWNYPHWRQTVYPKGLPARRWLEYYATLFDTVEKAERGHTPGRRCRRDLPGESATSGMVVSQAPGS